MGDESVIFCVEPERREHPEAEQRGRFQQGGIVERQDDYLQRRNHLASLSEEELEQRFWKLAGQITSPLVELARTHTTPSLERSVLLRMGFSSLEAKSIVEGCLERGLLGKGAGHVVLKLSQAKKMPLREAGLALEKGQLWDDAVALFSSQEVTK